MTTGFVERPAPDDDEETVAACAAWTPHGAALAHQHLESGDFWYPAPRRVFEAAIRVGHGPDRLHQIADLAEVPPGWLRQIVDDRPVMWDTAGSFARRVRAASLRRQLMCAAADLHAAAAADPFSVARHTLTIDNLTAALADLEGHPDAERRHDRLAA